MEDLSGPAGPRSPALATISLARSTSSMALARRTGSPHRALNPFSSSSGRSYSHASASSSSAQGQRVQDAALADEDQGDVGAGAGGGRRRRRGTATERHHAALELLARAPLSLALTALLMGGSKLVRRWWVVRASLPPPPPPQAPPSKFPLGLVWLRHDLRLHDHEPLLAALQQCHLVLPVYCFDPRDYPMVAAGMMGAQHRGGDGGRRHGEGRWRSEGEEADWGTPGACGSHRGSSRTAGPTGSAAAAAGAGVYPRCSVERARLLLSSLSDLRGRVRQLGSELLLRVGRPEVVLSALCRALGAPRVYCHAEVTREEVQAEGAVSQALQQVGAQLQRSWGASTLFYHEELAALAGSSAPDYVAFRRQVDHMPVRAPLPAPPTLGDNSGLHSALLTRAHPGRLPTLQDLGFQGADDTADATQLYSSAVPPTTSPPQGSAAGGETRALHELHAFVVAEATARLSGSTAEQGLPSPSRSAPGSKAYLSPPDCGAEAAGGGASVAVEGGEAGGALAAASAGRAGTPGSFVYNVGPWLALGCLSPRQAYHALRALPPCATGAGQGRRPDSEQQLSAGVVPATAPTSSAAGGNSQQQLHWMVFELLWRDFFRLITYRFSCNGSRLSSAEAAEVAAAEVTCPTPQVA